MVVGEHSLFCIKEQGQLRLQKRLDYDASAVAAYTRDPTQGPGGCDNLLISSFTNHLNVYRDTQLVWAARLARSPVALKVGRFGGIPGMVVTLDEAGELSVSYLGTDPPTTAVGATEAKELDYEAMDQEHKALLQQIRESQADRRVEPRDKLILRAQVPNTVDMLSDEDLMAVNADQGRFGHVARCGGPEAGPQAPIVRLTVRVYVSYTGSQTLDNVSLAIEVPGGPGGAGDAEGGRGIICATPHVTVSNVAGGRRTPLIVPVVFMAANNAVPHALTANISASFINSNGEPRITKTHFTLPLSLAARCIPPVKQSALKFTIDTNRPAAHLPALFEDLLAQVRARACAWGRGAKAGTAKARSRLHFRVFACTCQVRTRARPLTAARLVRLTRLVRLVRLARRPLPSLVSPLSRLMCSPSTPTSTARYSGGGLAGGCTGGAERA